MLDARPIPGGGAATEEMLIPGYRLDSCSTGHTIIQGNPLIAADELGLQSRFGLRYVEPDPVGHVAFPDGEQLTHWLDVERTVDEFARFSKRDADAYVRMLREWDEVKAIFGRSQNRPIGFGPSLEQELSDHPRGNMWKRRRMLSSWEVIRHEYESRHVQSYMLWQAYQTLVRPDSAGSGLLAYSVVASRQQRSWTIPVGRFRHPCRRPGGLPGVVRRTGGVQPHGAPAAGRGRPVRRRRDDRRRAVPRRHRGAVEHPRQAPAGHGTRRGVGRGLDLRRARPTRSAPPASPPTWRRRAPPEFVVDGAPRSAVSAGLVGWPEDVVRHGRDMADGEWTDEVPWLLIATPTLADPSRAPEGRHTVKLLGPQGWRLRDGDDWETRQGAPAGDVARGRAAALPRTSPTTSILAAYVKGPYDIEATNAHMIRGAFHGGDRSIAWSGPQRPVPGWASHRTPIAGLYQTGATTHPGGSITGSPRPQRRAGHAARPRHVPRGGPRWLTRWSRRRWRTGRRG